MFDYTKIEITAGAFLVVGLALVAYLSVSIAGFTLLPARTYRVRARFSNVGDLKFSAPVKLAGVTIGKVESIHLVDYAAEITLTVDRSIALPKDTVASITTAGLLGAAFLSLSPGADDRTLGNNDRIMRTEPAINVSDLIGRFAFGGESPSGTGADKKEKER